jgi:hypothetical protein
VLLRLYAQLGRPDAAKEVGVVTTRGALSGSIAEVMCSKALLLACAGRTAEARAMVQEVHGTTSALEPAVLAAAVGAVCAVRDGSDVIQPALALEDAAFRTGAVDLLVTSYRACPELLAVLLRAAPEQRLRDLLERVGDEDLAAARDRRL